MYIYIKERLVLVHLLLCPSLYQTILLKNNSLSELASRSESIGGLNIGLDFLRWFGHVETDDVGVN